MTGPAVTREPGFGELDGPPPDRVGRFEHGGHALEFPADRKARAAQFGQDPEYMHVGGVAAAEDNPATGERRRPHQRALAAPLVDMSVPHIDDEFSVEK